MTPSSMPAARSLTGFWAIRFVFMMEAVTIGAWLPRSPDFKISLAIDDGILGIVLAALPAGTMLGFVLAARFAKSIGLRSACMTAGPAFALSFILPGIAFEPFGLFAALFVCGFIVALIEVAMNTEAGVIEKRAGRRIMSQCHGFWSIGTVVGAALGGLFAQAATTPLWQFILLNPLFAIAAFSAAWMLPGDAPRQQAEAAGRFFVLPGRKLFFLCLMPVGIMALEGAMMDWSAVFVREVLLGQPFEAATAYVVFAAMMAVTRLAGDRLAERYGPARVVLVSSLAAALGAAMFSAAPGLAVALVGAALAGFGVATIYPLAVSAAAAAPGKSSEANVAAVSFIAFSIFLVGPPLIGGLAELFGLRIALALLVPGALAAAALHGSVRVTDTG
ncbi:MAG TPA: MFS transporter [Afifellaceae bacterium]|nr:MFS transporter [Afifellaceae bacterium]